MKCIASWLAAAGVEIAGCLVSHQTFLERISDGCDLDNPRCDDYDSNVSYDSGLLLSTKAALSYIAAVGVDIADDLVSPT